MRIMMTIFYLLLVLVGISFAGLNAQSVHINVYFTAFNIPVSVLIILMLSFGMLLGFCLSLCRYWRIKAECRKIKNQLKLTEKEIRNLRAIPLQDPH
ncbi:MAG TPA: DUF1049 domain-containing protein [Legionella sp.]|nr:DUF1049 domain-containing protein [Legionella sp.]